MPKNFAWSIPFVGLATALAISECAVGAYRLIKLRQTSKGVFATLILGTIGTVSLATLVCGSILGWLSLGGELVFFAVGSMSSIIPPIVLTRHFTGGEILPRTDSPDKLQRILRVILITARILLVTAAVILLVMIAYFVFVFGV